MMRLVLHLNPNDLVLTPFNSGLAYALLLGSSKLRLSARAGTPVGLGVSDPGSASVTLENSQRQMTRLVPRPLRVAADIYDRAGRLAFSGYVSGATYGRVVTLDLSL